MKRKCEMTIRKKCIDMKSRTKLILSRQPADVWICINEGCHLVDIGLAVRVTFFFVEPTGGPFSIRPNNYMILDIKNK